MNNLKAHNLNRKIMTSGLEPRAAILLMWMAMDEGESYDIRKIAGVLQWGHGDTDAAAHVLKVNGLARYISSTHAIHPLSYDKLKVQFDGE